jgi:hypothetical protein
MTMRDTTRILAILMVAVLGAVTLPTGSARAEIAGMVGVSPVTENSCAAIWLPVPEGQAVSGVRWYNNDDQVVFPRVLLASGAADAMVDLDEAVEVATGVQGVAEGWSEIAFDQPYGCHSEGLYCVFMLPEGSEYQAAGSGGGAAFGYVADADGHLGWLGGDDESWLRISAPFGLAIEPTLVPVQDGTVLMKSLAGGQAASAAPMLLGSRPNPFNPQTTLEYSLPAAMAVDLSIYDVRGQLVRRLVAGEQAAGRHTATWLGEDDEGRRQASGVYLVRFAAGDVRQTHRLVLVK